MATETVVTCDKCKQDIRVPMTKDYHRVMLMLGSKQIAHYDLCERCAGLSSVFHSRPLKEADYAAVKPRKKT